MWRVPNYDHARTDVSAYCAVAESRGAMSDEKKKSFNIADAPLLVIVVLALFAGLWMVSQAVFSEGEMARNALSAQMVDIQTLSRDVRDISKRLKRMELQAQQAAQQAGASRRRPAAPQATAPAELEAPAQGDD